MGLLDRLRSDDGPRVAFVGIDGVPYSFLADNFDEFENLAAIDEDGASGAIDSIVPPDSSAAWPALFTGVNPGETGVYGLLDREIDTYETYLPMGRDVQAERLWGKVHEDGRTATVMNVPVTFPPERGVQRMVSGFLSPSLEEAAYPDELREFLRDIDYRLDVDATLGHRDDKDEFIEDAHDVLDRRFEAFEQYVRKDDWDLFFGVFLTPDRINHFLFPEYEQDGEYREEFVEFYRKLDRYVGKLREALAEDVTLVVASDHGFTTLRYEVNCNEWLRENGWLSYTDGDDYVVQLNNCLRDAGLLVYEGDGGTGTATRDGEPPDEASDERLDVAALDTLRRDDPQERDHVDDLLSETDVAAETGAVAPAPGTVNVFDAGAVEDVRDALESLTGDDGTRLIESVESRTVEENGVAVELDVRTAGNVRLEVDHTRTGDPIQPTHTELNDIATETRAYSFIPGRFYLNLEGREPRGSVPKDDYDEVRDELKAQLEGLTGPDGEPVVERVETREDAFRGAHDEMAPDLVAIPNDGFDLKAAFQGKKRVFETSRRGGMHTFDDAALFVDHPDARITDADLYDIVPTILSLLEVEYDRAVFDGATLVK